MNRIGSIFLTGCSCIFFSLAAAGTPPETPMSQQQKDGVLKRFVADVTRDLVPTNAVVNDSLAQARRATNAPPEVNPALRETQNWISSTNLTEQAHSANERERIRQLQIKLEQARRQRQERNSAHAVRLLVSVLQADAPEELKRTALLELALVAQQENQFARAEQIFAQYVRRYPQDPSVPEVLLRQGLVYRQMGANTMALAKFYAVMTTALNLKLDHLSYYQRLVVQAQAEIADTYYWQGKFAEAADLFARLLQQRSPELNNEQIQFKLVRCLSSLERHSEAAAEAEDLLKRFPDTTEKAETRFLLASSLKQLNRTSDALKQVFLLLQSQQETASQDPQNWAYWQRRAGNEIANQIYKEGDYANALVVYLRLLELDAAPSWQLPVLYQVGLVYERLGQPQRATESYARIIEREKELASAGDPSLKAVMDMARWRKNHLGWYTQAELNRQALDQSLLKPQPPKAP